MLELSKYKKKKNQDPNENSDFDGYNLRSTACQAAETNCALSCNAALSLWILSLSIILVIEYAASVCIAVCEQCGFRSVVFIIVLLPRTGEDSHRLCCPFGISCVSRKFRVPGYCRKCARYASDTPAWDTRRVKCVELHWCRRIYIDPFGILTTIGAVDRFCTQNMRPRIFLWYFVVFWIL